MLLILNNMYENTIMPFEWSVCNMNTLKKPGLQADNPDNYRGMSVVNVIAKVYNNVICLKTEAGVKINEAQVCGFKRCNVNGAALPLRSLYDRHAWNWKDMKQAAHYLKQGISDHHPDAAKFIKSNYQTQARHKP